MGREKWESTRIPSWFQSGNAFQKASSSVPGELLGLNVAMERSPLDKSPGKPQVVASRAWMNIPPNWMISPLPDVSPGSPGLLLYQRSLPRKLPRPVTRCFASSH